MTPTASTAVSSLLPSCGHCGRPVGWGDPFRAHNGIVYHFECTRPPQPWVPTTFGIGSGPMVSSSAAAGGEATPAPADPLSAQRER